MRLIVKLIYRPSGGIKTFSDFKKEENKPEDKDAIRWYTGGESSGTEVEAPNKNRKALLDNIVKAAAK